MSTYGPRGLGPNGHSVWRAGGLVDLRVFDANQNQLGYANDWRLNGLPSLESATQPDDVSFDILPRTIAVPAGGTVTIESELRFWLDGQPYNVRYAATPLDADGDPWESSDCANATDPVGVGVSVPTDFITTDFRSSVGGGGSNPVDADPLDSTFEHCIVSLIDVDEPSLCVRDEIARDAYVAAIVSSDPSVRLLGTHFDEMDGATAGPSLAVLGTSCDVELDLTDTAWDNVISSTRPGCAGVDHWTDYDSSGTPPVGLSGQNVLVSGTERTGLGNLLFQISGLRYLESVVPQDFVYVALGDSFASGEGTGNFINIGSTRYESGANFDSVINDNTLTALTPVAGVEGNACHRSLINYAKINYELFEPAANSVLVDRTCSGAQILPTGDDPQPPIADSNVGGGTSTPEELAVASQLNQAQWVLGQRGFSGEDVDLVTVSMGGNDVGFSPLIEACITARVAREATDRLESAANLLARLTPDELDYLPTLGAYLAAQSVSCEAMDSRAGNESTRSLLQQYDTKLEEALDDLATQFPNARILQVNYPAFLPEVFPDDTCSGIHPADVAYALETADMLNTKIAEGIAAANIRHGDRFEVVDVTDRLGPNPLCPAASDGVQLVNSIPEGAVDRVLDRLTDPTKEPGIFLDQALIARDISECLTLPLGPLTCYSDSQLDQFLEWVGENVDVIAAQLATVDDVVSFEDRDRAAFENFRGLFHPNELGFEIIACNVRAVYFGSAQEACDNPQTVGRTYLLNGAAVNRTQPLDVVPGEIVPLSVDGWDPETAVEGFFRSELIALGALLVDSSGVVDANVTIPPEATPGVHRVELRGTTAGGSDRIVTFYVDIAGTPEPGTLTGVFVRDLAPFEFADLTYLGTEFGRVQADEFGTAYVEVAVPLDAVDTPVNLTITDETSPVQEAQISAVVPTCFGQTPTIVGTLGDDVIVGTAGPDVIHGLAGDDTISGLEGNDIICGGAGDDELVGNEDDDVIDGGDGNDVIGGGKGDDTLNGGVGNDIIDGKRGNDTINGGAGDDELVGNEDDDVIDGGVGNDVIGGGKGDDTLNGGVGYDIVDGKTGYDTCSTGEAYLRCELVA